jgi:hypothetical protein
MKNVELEKKINADLSTRLPNDRLKYGTHQVFFDNTVYFKNVANARQFASDVRDMGYTGVTTIPDNGVRIDWNSFQ